jgi:beta-N-acetylhexosaminidase
VEAARGVITSHHRHGVLTVLKHFPGHGSSKADSHKGFADVTHTWSERELIPYLRLQNDVDMIMTSHIFNNDLDQNYPATLSVNVLTDLLRKKLHYQGVIISDDMGMKAISDHYTLQKSVTLAINAGVDILLFANTTQYDENITQRVIAIIKKQVESGRIPMSRIDASYNRIQALRKKMKSISSNSKRESDK